MFGKPRAAPSAADRLPHSLVPECNVAILGCRGAGKSGEGKRARVRVWGARRRVPAVIGVGNTPVSRMFWAVLPSGLGLGV